ncbi:MAG: hypothetical protein NTZ78_03450 [Candidatus Aureabacteria bacterium]|nr:hypothetical protein [Candidatus Auribacterota bacterium]
MIERLLAQMEKSPSVLFRRAELLKQSRADFITLRRNGLLAYVQPDERGTQYPCPVSDCENACAMDVFRRDGEYYAVCPENLIEPRPLSADDLARYRLDLDAVADRFRKENSLDGCASRLDQRLFYLGEAKAGGFTLAVVLGLFPDARAALTPLLALPGMVSGLPDRCLVAFPSLQITGQAELVNLENHDVYTTTLSEKDPFNVDLSPALKKAPARPAIITLTPTQEKEFSRHGFKSRLPIEITGEVERRADNIIRVAGAKVALEDAELRLFLRLAVELFKGRDGCIYKGDSKARGGLVDEDILRPDSIDQTINRLRGRFTPALKDLPPTDFIEAYHQKHIRLSTHPAYIRFSKDRLLQHHDAKIKQLASQLPGKVNGKS